MLSLDWGSNYILLAPGPAHVVARRGDQSIQCFDFSEAWTKRARPTTRITR